jgi:hypothetical protein
VRSLCSIVQMTRLVPRLTARLAVGAVLAPTGPAGAAESTPSKYPNCAPADPHGIAGAFQLWTAIAP